MSFKLNTEKISQISCYVDVSTPEQWEKRAHVLFSLVEEAVTAKA